MKAKEEKKKKTAAKGGAIFKKMLEDKKAIHEHLRKGGSFEELKQKGYRFATV